jgi:hypothetical protein
MKFEFPGGSSAPIRPGVIPARVAGAALLKAITISVTGRLLRYDGSQLMLEDE